MTEPDRDGLVMWVGEQGPELQVVVPVGMEDLLDNWTWSLDAARWDPDVAMGNQPERSTRSIPGQVTLTVRIDTRALEAAMRGVAQNLRRAVASFERLKGMAPTLEVFDELSGPPTDVRGRALWLKQHRNTGPERPRGIWYGR